MATPRYQTLEEIPTPNGILHPGAIIDFAGPPGPHLYPLNDEARARMEEWYQEWYEVEQTLPDGNKVMAKHQPHMQFRQVHSAPAPQHEITIVAAPASQPGKGQSLAESSVVGVGRRTFDQRPGPADGSTIRREFEQGPGTAHPAEETLAENTKGQFAVVASAPHPAPGDPGSTIVSTKR